MYLWSDLSSHEFAVQSDADTNLITIYFSLTNIESCKLYINLQSINLHFNTITETYAVVWIEGLCGKILWIFINWIIFGTNILDLVCPRQKWLSPNGSNSSEIIQGSLVGPNSVHFGGSITYTGAWGGLQSHIWNFE